MNIESLSGKVLGQYELHELLGVGGMGVVYRAYQKILDREVAIKVLSPALISEEAYRERFAREAKTAASLEHTHIIPIYDYGIEDGINYIVMRLLQGGSLEARLAPGEAPFSALEISTLLDQLASALDYAHERGIIHRDIKTNNVMFDTRGLAYLVDFGIARLLNTASGLTTTGSVVGTPLYMAPEQWRDEPVSTATDQYALAVLIYVILTGQFPFEASTPYGLMQKHLFHKPAAPHVLRPDLPELVKPVLDKALAKNPENRYANASEFALAFKAAVSGSGTDTPLNTSNAQFTPAVSTPDASFTNNTIALADTDTNSSVQAAPLIRNKMLIWLSAIIVIVIAGLFLYRASQTSLQPGKTESSSTATGLSTEVLIANVFFPGSTASASRTHTPDMATDTASPTLATPVVEARRDLPVRSGPGTQYPVISQLDAGDSLDLTGRNLDGSWYQVLLPDGSHGWIVDSISLTTVTGRQDLLPVIEAPLEIPSDTPTNHPTATNTATASPTLTLTPTTTMTATAIPPLTSICGSLSADQLRARHELVWQSDDVVAMTLSASFDSFLQIESPAGEILFNDDCRGTTNSCIRPYRLSESGLFTISIDSYDHQSTGDYCLEITYISSCAGSNPIAIVPHTDEGLNLRTGPDTTYRVSGIVQDNECLAIIGQIQSGAWIQVQTETFRTGWIRADLLTIYGGLTDIPISSP